MEKRSLWDIFFIFAKIGAFTIGGGYAMIPIIESEMERRGWLKGEELDDIVTLAQSAPGLLAVNVAIFAGHKLRGWKGSVIATLGAILPSFLIILAIAIFFNSFRENKVIGAILHGLRPVAIALIVVPAVRMASRHCKDWWQWGIAVATLALVAVLNISPIYILLVLIIVAASISAYRK